MKIKIATDHAGFELKEKLKSFLVELGHEVEDFGAFKNNPDDDYPDFIRPCAEAVAKDGGFGIVLGGSGYGEAMVCNRLAGIRTIVYYGGSSDMARLGREHNNANVLSLGARFINEDEAIEAVLKFLNTEFSGDERHARRINKIDN